MKQVPDLLADAFDEMSQGFGVFDSDLKLVACNRQFSRIRDYPAKLCRPGVALEELLRYNAERGDYDIDEVDTFLADRIKKLRRLEGHEVEREVPGGRTIIVRYDPIPGGGLLASFIDITALRKAEQRVRELAKLPEQNPGPVLRFSRDGSLLYANPASGALTSLLNLAPGDPLPEAWRESFDEVVRDARDRELEFHEGGNTYVLSFCPIKETGNVNLYGRDISALAQAERTIKELAELPEQNPGPVLRFSAQDVLLYGNEASNDLRVGLALETGDCAPEDWRPIFSGARKRKEPRDVEFELGDKTYVLTIYPVAETGNINVYGRDITARKEAEQQLQTARDEAVEALEKLKQAQASLVHAEKMASLGQLTAGIAHEIKNPLNFVNNFADVSGELLSELRDGVQGSLESLAEEAREDALDLFATLSGNLEKIKEHGARADRIVKSMLSHAWEGEATAQATDLNGLLEESLNLAYHGARAENPDFNVTLERDLDAQVGEVEVYPQEIMRVFLNLIGNGFHATHKRNAERGEADYAPVLKVSTRSLGAKVEVRVRDNGTGMAPEVLEKVFEPFFTTKPTGEGTGLGLSLSYDTVTKQHRGRIEALSEEGAYTEFVVTLPRRIEKKNGGVS